MVKPVLAIDFTFLMKTGIWVDDEAWTEVEKRSRTGKANFNGFARFT